MTVPLVIFHPMDPRGGKVGGAEMFVRGLIGHAPADFDVELVGVSALGPARGSDMLTEGNVRFRFRPLIRAANEDRRPFIPLSFRYTLALWPERAAFRNRILFFNRIEALLPFRGSADRKIVAIHNDVPRQIGAGPGEVLWSRWPRGYFAMERRCLNAADLVLSESRATIEHCRRRYAMADERIAFLPLWFEPGLFFPGADRVEEKKALARRNPALRDAGEWVLFTGRFQPQKAPLRMIEAFDRLRRTRPGATLLLIGAGDLMADMVKAVEARGMRERVVFLGSKPWQELAAFYRAADAFLLASDYEGMPMSVLEALACGLPVVSTPVGEVPAIVASGVSGEIAENTSPDALASALERLLANRSRFTVESCVAAVRAFTPRAVLDPLYDRIRGLARQRAAGRTR